PDPNQLVPDENTVIGAGTVAWYILRVHAAIVSKFPERTDEVYEEIELPLLPVLSVLEKRGVAVDLPLFQAHEAELRERVAGLEQQAFAAIGHEVNLSSPKQLQQVLFDELDMPKTRKTQTGYTTDAQGNRLDKNGKPTVTMPKSKAPAKLDIATLIQGEGDTVKDGDQVTVHYVGAIWRNGEVFNSSWDGGQPATFTVAYPNGVIEGSYKALVGAKVGSQVIAIVPPSAGYGKNTAENLKGSAKDVKNDDTLVFVVDILATSHTK
ncbi:MAG: FKBP-type peptidyl-prolyl cis-trans isomerase, partial [Actinobacteria bacterium]|nr:FKBP-type peptidyl-prolyl cis-trans isomerase [Actinomycetota bacterium]